MTTKVEAAYAALLAALTEAAGDDGAHIPAPSRNAGLIEAFTDSGGVVQGGVYLNQADDDARPIDVEAGGDGPQYEFWQAARIEWIVERKSGSEREALFDAGLEEIRDALLADRTLGGVVDDLEIDPPVRRDITLHGAPRIKACVVPVRLLLTASSYLG